MSGQRQAAPPEWLRPDWPAAGRVRALSTTRHGGVSAAPYATFNVGDHVGDDPAAVAANRARLRACLPGEPCWLRQVHGTRVVEAQPGQPAPEADAAFTRVPGVVLAIQAADCLPVLLAARDGSVIAAAHAGWRGLSGGVIENALAAMQVDPAAVQAWLGPAIGQDAYQVGGEVEAHFTWADPRAAAAFRPDPVQPGRYRMDLYALARQRLAASGVGAIHGGGFCTATDAGRFFSYRRDGPTGRMASLLWIGP